MENIPVVYTVGHSTHTLEKFIEILRQWNIDYVIDVRTETESEYSPQYNKAALEKSLHTRGMAYQHLKDLTASRRVHPHSKNLGWINASMRGYADYMQGSKFEKAISQVLEIAKNSCVVLMCGEESPWRCHRYLIGDYLQSKGIQVIHILAKNQSQDHIMTPFARIVDDVLVYPKEANQKEGVAEWVPEGLKRDKD